MDTNGFAAAGEGATDSVCPDSRLYKVTFGQQAAQTEWPASERQELTWPEVIEQFTRHRIGKKDGRCMVPGWLKGNRRRKDLVASLSLLVLDSDKGYTLEELRRRFKKHGVAAIISSTHSHLTTTTEVAESAWTEWQKGNPDGTAADFLRHLGYLPRVCEGATRDEGVAMRPIWNQTTGRMENKPFVVIRHAPCAKFRIVLPLATSWTSEGHENGIAAANAWAPLYLAAGLLFGLSIDTSCQDVHRLFYLPRRNADAPPAETAVLEGRCLTLEELEAAAAEPQGETKRQRGERRQREFFDADGEWTDLNGWAREGCADRFEIVTALEARQPGVILGRQGEKATITCPFEDHHSSAGGAGTFAVNASGIGKAGLSHRKKGFYVGCQHNGCKLCERDRLDFLERMLELGWLTVDDLKNPEFLTEAPAGETSGAAADENAGWRAKHAAEIEKFNRCYFVTKLNGKTVIASSARDELLKREKLEFSSERDLSLLYRNVYVQVGVKKGSVKEDGEQKSEPIYKPVASAWVADPRRRTYDGGIALIPRGEVPEGVYNLWRGWGVDPKPGEWPVLADLLLNVICSGNKAYFEWLRGWMARCVQFPEKQAEVAVVTRGLKGTGKGTFAKIMQAFFRSHHVHISNSQHLTGHFNAHLMDALFLFLDEALWAGDKAGEGVLKTTITEDTLHIEPKGVDSFTMPNRLKIVISSNEGWVVPATADERRFFMLDVSPHRKADDAYWDRVNAAIKGDECGALLDYLLKLDISNFRHRNPPHTRALGTQKLRSADSVTRFWHDCLEEGAIVGQGDEWPAQVPTKQLHAAYIEHATKHGVRHRLPSSEMVKRLDQLWDGCGVRRMQPSGKTTGGRGRVYVLDTLEAHRTAFLKAMKIDPDHYAWPAEESDAGEGNRTHTGGEQDRAPEKPSVSAGRNRGNRGNGTSNHQHAGDTDAGVNGGAETVSSKTFAAGPKPSCSPCSPCSDPRKHCVKRGTGSGSSPVPPVPPSSWADPDPFAGLDGTFHHSAGPPGVDPNDISDLLN